MPAKTEKQREAMAIALHSPGKLHKKNLGMLSMSEDQLRDFAKKKKHSKGLRGGLEAAKDDIDR